MAREKRKFEIEDTFDDKHVSGGKLAWLKMPAGLEMFDNSKPRTVRLEFMPFHVTDAHRKFTPQLQYSRPGAWYPHRIAWVHRYVGTDGQDYVCASKTFGKRCPICDERARLAKLPDKESKELAYGLRPKERQLFLVAERDDRTGELGRNVLLWEDSYHLFGKQLYEVFLPAADPEDREAYKRYFNPDGGYTVKVTGVQKEIGSNKCMEWSVVEFKPRKDDIPDDLIDHGYDLDAMVREIDYDTLKKIFLGAGDDDGESAPAERNGDRRPAPREVPQGRQERAEAPSRERNGRDAEPARSAPAPRPAPAREPEKNPEPEADYRKGDSVSFEYRGEETVGVVDSVNHEKGVVYIQVPGRERLMTMDFTDVRLVEDAGGEELPSAKPSSGGRAAKETPAEVRKSQWDDGEDDSPPAAKPPARPARKR